MAEWDIPNWTTMIVEIIVAGFAVGISIFFYKREKKERVRSDKLTKKIEDLLLEQKEIRRERREYLKINFRYYSQILLSVLSNIGTETLQLDSPVELIDIHKKHFEDLLRDFTDLMNHGERSKLEELVFALEDMRINILNKKSFNTSVGVVKQYVSELTEMLPVD